MMMVPRTAVMIVVTAAMTPIVIAPFVMGMMPVRVDNHGGGTWGAVRGTRIKVPASRQSKQKQRKSSANNEFHSASQKTCKNR